MLYTVFFKSLIDLILSFLGLIFMFPLFFIIGIIIKVTSDGPAFFLQERVGKDEKIFRLYKFRTMTNKKRDINDQIFEGNKEITYIGEILRRFKIDELPQLINVLKGEMSIIGPRPCLPELKDKFGEFSKYRFTAKPGLTSLAAIKGSIYLTMEEKGYYDYYYVKNLSFKLDTKIILKTISIIMVGEKKLFSKNF